MNPRIEPLPPQRWSEAARRTYAEAMKTPVLGELSDRPTLAVVSTLATNDWLFDVSMPFLASISGGRIPLRERELVVLRIAYLARSQYMWSHHCVLDGWREPRPFPVGSDADEDHDHHGDQDQSEEAQVADGVHPIGNAPG
ncbi:hypothetical protein [Nocardia terpenica]|uniref:Carboxymuconolactone decarboxylase-like domain-containing protein n=1 Tax=Nocardia terpenica TaxID=455432 RepID=A0A6G9Z5G8_9NOCA|nr:hypothetical protein [Nocardia terpenica]QIS20641.1 hypothetical protein F6W96_22400 [Nocardia terpenica]